MLRKKVTTRRRFRIRICGCLAAWLYVFRLRKHPNPQPMRRLMDYIRVFDGPSTRRCGVGPCLYTPQASLPRMMTIGSEGIGWGKLGPMREIGEMDLVFAADMGVMWMLFAGYFLTLPSPLRRHTLRWCPLVMKGELKDIATKASQGQPVVVPIKVGPCVIRRVEMRDGRPCLWTDTNPNGYAGFVRNRYGEVNRAAGRLPNTAFNLWSRVALDGEWAFISED